MAKERLAARLSEIISSTTVNNDVINEVLLLLNNFSTEEVADTLENVNSGVLFERLLSSSPTSEDAVRLLNKLLSCLSATVLISQFKSTLLHGLHQPISRVREVILKQLERCAKDTGGFGELTHSVDILCIVARLLGHDDLGIAKHSSAILYCLGSSNDTLQMLLDYPIKQEITEAMAQGGDTVRFRVYDLMISIVCNFPSALPLVAAEYSDQLLEELESNDVLLQLNCVERLTTLALTNHGLSFLEQQGAIEKFSDILLEYSPNNYAKFLFHGLIKFFGNLGIQHPDKFFADHTEVLHFILRVIDIESQDPSLITLSLETLAAVGSSSLGKRKLDTHAEPEILANAFYIMGCYMERGAPELRLSSLQAISTLLQVKKSEVCLELDNIVEKFFRLLNSDPVGILLSVSKLPFTDLRCAALDVIKQIASRPWGQRSLQTHPGCIEYLLDRTTDADKESKEAKFAVVQEIVESSSAGSVFDADVLDRLTQFHKEGPFYVATQMEVSYEQGS